MKRHRILYIEFLKITAANHLAMIIKGVMQRLDCEIVLLCEKDSLLARTFRNTSVIVYEIPFQELMIHDFHTYLPFLRHILLIFRILIRYRITLIHVHRLNWAYLAIVPSLLFRIPLVVHIVIIERLSSKFQNKLLLLHRSIHYIAVSNDAARKFIKTYPVSSSQVHIHYGGLYFPDMELARNMYINKQELPKKAVIVAMVSRMDPLKGVDVFIEAAGILHKQFPAIQFIHIGDHDDYVFQEGYGRECKSRVKNLGLSRVFSFRPYTENILAYYKYFFHHGASNTEGHVIVRKFRG